MAYVSVILPCYKERENLAEIIPRLSKAFSGSGQKMQIVVVDDYSGDGTEKEISNLKRHYDILFIQRKGKGGLASAVIRGVKASKGDACVVMDADGQHPVDVAPKLARALGKFDVAVGSRFSQGGVAKDFGPHRRLISFGAYALCLPFIGFRSSDPLSGFFAARKKTSTLAG